MANSKKQNDNYGEAFYIAAAVIAIVFSLYHFLRLKRQYLSGPDVRRIFDMAMGWKMVVQSGAVAILFILVSMSQYHDRAWTAVISVPLGLVILNWVGKVQAHAFLGVIVDYTDGVVRFPPNLESLDVGDYLTVMPVIRTFARMDSLPLADIQRITRQAGKSLFVHGDFASRRITFSNKLKRDECIHLITANRGKQVRLESELE